MLNKSAVASAISQFLSSYECREEYEGTKIIYKGNDIKPDVDTSSHNSYAKKQRKKKRRK